jgi:hypothetical protein
MNVWNYEKERIQGWFALRKNLDGVVSIVTRLQAGLSSNRVRFPCRGFSKTLRLALGPIQLPVRWILAVKMSGREVDH